METVYCGIDFHKNTSTICALKKDGELVERITVKTSNLVKYLSNRQNYLIGIEASGGTNDMAQRLKDSGHQVKIINTNKFKAIGLGGIKNDDKDARDIAEVLRLNYIPEVYHKSLYARQIKSLLIGREQLVRSRVNMVNHVRGILREYGISMPKGMDAFWANISHALKEELECPYIQEHLRFLVEKIQELKEQEVELEKLLSTFTKEDQRAKKLRTVPGIGPMGSLAMLAVVDDCGRFKNAKHFASYLGLVPSEHSSGDKRRMGTITRSGSEILRRYLIHGARSVLRHAKDDTNDYNRLWALRLKARVGMNKATVALAHRMARIAFAILKENNEYQLELPIKECKKAA